METNKPPKIEEPEDFIDKIFDWYDRLSVWFKDLVAIRETDNIIAVLLKLLLRLVGIIIVIALTPVAIVSIFIAFLLVT